MNEEKDSWFIPKIFIGIFFMNVFLFMLFSQGSAEYARDLRDKAINTSSNNTDEKIAQARQEITIEYRQEFDKDFNKKHCQAHFPDYAWCEENND